jgi:CBS domain containing-hemolysin-like protein
MPEGVLFQASAVVACLIISALVSACETALTSLSRSSIGRIQESSERARSSIQPWVDRPRHVLISILILNNLVNITASALATTLAQTLLHDAGQAFPWLSPVAVAVGVMTLLLLTFGEITPKTLARTHAESAAPVLLWILRPVMFVITPFTLVFAAVTEAMAPQQPGETDTVSEQDIEMLVRLARKDGQLSGLRERLLRSVFSFTDTTAREVMVPRTDVESIPVDISFDALMSITIGGAHSRLPVYEGTIDNVIGLCYVRDLLQIVRNGRSHEPFELRRHLRPARFVPESKPISAVLADMQQYRIHMAIVLDEFGGMAGLVTLEDIIEQFFGDIQDEFDREEEWMLAQPDGSWRVDARHNFSEFADHIGLDADVEDEDFDSLGGFIAKHTGTIDARGQSFDAYGFQFTVVDATARRIRWVRVQRLRPQDTAAPAPAEEAQEG